MMKQLAMLALLCGMLAADQFTFQGQGVVSNTNTTTTETWQIGYGAQGIASNDGDNMIEGTIIGLAICAFIFSYLHSNSESFIWSQLWLLFAVLMIVGVAMAIDTFATEQGNTVIAGVAYALFMAFICVFMILIIRLMFVLIKSLIDELMAVLNGRKTNKGGQ